MAGNTISGTWSSTMGPSKPTSRKARIAFTMSTYPSSMNVSENVGTVPVTFRKCTKWNLSRVPKYRIASNTSPGIAEIVPTQKVRPLASLGTMSTTRLSAA